jgi:hypothetical protein
MSLIIKDSMYGTYGAMMFGTVCCWLLEVSCALAESFSHDVRTEPAIYGGTNVSAVASMRHGSQSHTLQNITMRAIEFPATR